jgi:predicted transcriptional regulator
MRNVTFSVGTLDDMKRRVDAALRGKKRGSHVSFSSPELFLRTLTVKRWEIVRAMTGAGPMSIREVARRVNRDVKAVHGDVAALLKAGILRKEDGRVVFPFDEVRLDVRMKAA